MDISQVLLLGHSEQADSFTYRSTVDCMSFCYVPVNELQTSKDPAFIAWWTTKAKMNWESVPLNAA